MSDEQNHSSRHHSRIVTLLWVSLFLIISYPLSIGPVTVFAAILDHYGYQDWLGFLEYVYMPLAMLCSSSELCETMLECYLWPWYWAAEQMGFA